MFGLLQPGIGRRCRRAALAAAVGLLLAPRPAAAQRTTPAQPFNVPKSLIKIPYQLENNGRRVQQVQLWVSEDQGRTWRQSASVAPTGRPFFDFQAPRDGAYWFTTRTVDQEGVGSPTAVEGQEPGPVLHVRVDTLPPAVDLRPLPSQGGMVGVEWTVREDNPDWNGFALEYRLAGAAEWFPLAPDRQLVGRKLWHPPTNAPLEVRLRLRDQAGHPGEKTARLGGGGGAEAAPVSSPSEVGGAPGGGTGSGTATPGIPGLRLVNSRNISLGFQVTDKGKSGVSLVELWMTRDGQGWQKHRERNDTQSPFGFEVDGEGLYGFRLLARSGVGLAEPPPGPGDAPHVWVEVDLTKPSVRLQHVEVGRGSEAGNLTILWQASDKNLAEKPVTLLYAEGAEGPWKPIVANQENSGRYIWRMPNDVPYKFFVKVEVTDRARNVASDGTPAERPVVVDLTTPRVQVTGVEVEGGK